MPPQSFSQPSPLPPVPSAQPVLPPSLSLAEQYAFTSGLCGPFAEAAQPIIGGVPTVLISTDPRVAARHDHPVDLDLELHVFLAQPDGSVVDAEGRRPLRALLRGFGVLKGYAHRLEADPDWSLSRRSFGEDKDALWVHVMADRLRELGWGPAAVPLANGALNHQALFREAQAAWEGGWFQTYKERRERYRSPIPGVALPPPRKGRPVR